MSDRSRWFVSTEWLAAHRDDPDVVVVDGSWHLAVSGRDGHREYDAAHIPDAVFFDIDAIANTAIPLPHMLPSAEVFATAVGALGIDEKQRIVVYDSDGLGASPRVWWTFRVMGAKDVVILDGGLPKWIAEGRPVDARPVSRPPRRFVASPLPGVTRTLAEVRDGLAAGAFQVVDARPAARFHGAAPEPRPWVRTGRIPGSLSLPSSELVADGRLRDEQAIRDLFAAASVDLAKPIVTSCGSGVNAATLSLALETIGVPVENSSLYDGSWTEWGARDDTEIAVG